MTTTIPHVYPVTEVVKVTDGDTFWLRVDVGFRESLLAEIRLLGWDTPELRKGTPTERQMGKVASVFTGDWLLRPRDPGRMYVHTEPDPDDFGRWLGDVWFEPEDENEPIDHLGEALFHEGLDVAWPKRWHEVHPE